MKARLLLLQIIVIAVIGILYLYFGIHKSFFWSLWWWDIPLHMLGGLWAALFSAWVYAILGGSPPLRVYIFGALIIGIAWELLEYFGGFPRSPFMEYRIDVIKDIAMDAIGGMIAAAIMRIRL